MVATVVIEARLREGLGLGTPQEADQNEGDTLDQPPGGCCVACNTRLW